MTVANVYKFSNGMIMTFDGDGNQMPDLQGEYSKELHKEIVDASTNETKWSGFDRKVDWK
jgi:hypothetical protein